jgi:DNA polymerase-3 subunit delta'
MNVLIAHPKTEEKIQHYMSNPSHAIAIVGSEGSGKSYVANYLAANLLGLSLEKLTDYPYVYKVDVRQIDAGIDEVRELQKKLSLQVPGKQTIKRVIILQNIELFRHEAQNALLKTLEEPPTDTVILLTLAKKDLVLPTIHSRLQELRILPLNFKSTQKLFSNKYTETEITKAYRLSGGEVGLMLALLENSQDHELVKAVNQAKDLLKMSRYERLSSVDSITKDKTIPPARVLDAVYRLLDASLRQQIANDQKIIKLAIMQKRLELVLKALKDIELGINSKLIISRLFYNL